IIVCDQGYVEGAFAGIIVGMRRLILIGSSPIAKVPQVTCGVKTLIVGIQLPSRYINNPRLQVELSAGFVIYFNDRVLGNRNHLTSRIGRCQCYRIETWFIVGIGGVNRPGCTLVRAELPVVRTRVRVLRSVREGNSKGSASLSGVIGEVKYRRYGIDGDGLHLLC